MDAYMYKIRMYVDAFMYKGTNLSRKCGIIVVSIIFQFIVRFSILLGNRESGTTVSNVEQNKSKIVTFLGNNTIDYMERYFKRKNPEESSTPTINNEPSKQSRKESDLPELQADPGLRPRIMDYDPNIREQVRRAYLLKGPCQPRNHQFRQRNFSGFLRRFNSREDSTLNGDQGGGDCFVGEEYTNWKKKRRLKTHERSINGAHRQAQKKCQDLLNQKQHIEIVFSKLSDDAKRDYKVRLTASIDCARFLLRQGLSFRGRDESELSNNQGNFLELLKFLCVQNENVRAVSLKNALENLKLTSPKIQKDICNAAAIETTNAIMEELGDEFFSILLDDSRDVSTKEQMAVALRYVDKRGCMVERFVGIKHVTSTNALPLKNAIEDLFSTHNGASNMQGEFNGLKSLILRENESSCKCRDALRENRAAQIIKALSLGDITSGKGLNQGTTLSRASDTRWGSHYGTLLSVVTMFDSVIDVLDVVVEDASSSDQKLEAFRLLKGMQSFDFVFNLHLMKSVLGITNDLSQALQRKEHGIYNAMTQVQICKQRLQSMRDSGWSSLMDEVFAFCRGNNIGVSSMEGLYVAQGRSRRRAHEKTISHHYHFEVMNTVIDRQLQELDNRFNEVSTELLLCVACLNPSNSFASFDEQRLNRFAKFYPKDFSCIELLAILDQLENFIIDVRSSFEFSNLKGIGDLAQKMVETRRDIGYPLVYKLLKLALVLPVSTATVERAFSAMKIVKSRLRNRMGDQWMHDSLLAYIEREIFDSISNEAIMNRFQNMTNRHGQL
ncbi:uncharacterized protein LOC131299720 [Rhododendron vialii]|uniref:uncharacterized protein LOC131299720 n=1 Tax=Rhododendron vialii TaxID=182163 RepID=UPI00265DBC2C|nr:uncharacterized protein LOC131299720 [Rhododendron vialii]